MPASAWPPVFPDAALPAPLTGFVGREAEVAAVSALLADSRLLTLTGAGGSGKTRLALEVAVGIAAREPDVATAWIELAGVTDPDAVVPHVAIALGVRAEGGGSAMRALSAVLQERPTLLVLDNCEHLVEACASLVERLLQLAPRLRVLATSREALGVGGERSWLVPTLVLPPDGCDDVATAAATSSVQLFVERARDASPSFALTPANVAAVVTVCRRLDGLPLAIELAASRCAVLTPVQLAERIADRFSLLVSGSRSAPPRQRTLRGAVEWSYGLLDDTERLLLARLAVFVGGFTLEAAETVCGFGALPVARVLEVLSQLATKSLVAMQEEQGQARYRLLEIIREYAHERLVADGEAETLGRRHAEYFLGVVAAREEDVILARRAALHELDVEYGNLGAAIAWGVAHGATNPLALPMLRGLLWYWFHRQRWREGFAVCEQVLAAASDPPPGLRAAALHGLGVFGLHHQHPQADAWLAEAERHWIAAGEERWLAFTLLVRVVAASIRGDVAAAEGFASRALALGERRADPWDAALAKAHAMVPVLNWQGQWSRAGQLLDEAIAAFRRRAYHTGVSYALDAQAFVALQMGDLERAAGLAAESLRSEWDNENRWLAGRSLRILATVAERRGDLRRAATLFAVTERWYEQVGASSLSADRAAVNELPARLAQRLSDADRAEIRLAADALTWTEARQMALEGVALLPAETPAVASEPPRPPEASAGRDAAAPGRGLHVRALGRLAIHCEGRSLDPAAWPYAKPRELLLYLLAHPEGRTRDQIGLDFWPEAAAAQVKNNFHVTLHHLRKTLGTSASVRFEKGRYAVTGEALWFDATTFRREVGEALARLRRVPDDAAALARLEQAVALYGGPFGEDAELGEWHSVWRDELTRLYEAALLALGEAASVEGRHGEATGWFRRALAADVHHEEAARLLMLTLARDDRRSEALRVYDKLVQDLQEGLAARPATGLQRLAEAIRAGERV